MKKLLIVLALLCLPVSSWAAVSCVDANRVEASTQVDTDPYELAYTVPSGSNQVLFVATPMRATGTPTVTVTGAGETLLQVGDYARIDNVDVALWYLVNPTPGATTISVAYSITMLAQALVVWTCSGVDQVTPLGTANTATGTGTAITVTIADDPGDITVDAIAADTQITGDDPDVGADQTVIHAGTSDNSELGYGSSWQPGNGGVMSWTRDANGTQDWAIIGVAVKPAAEASILMSPPVPAVVFQ